MGLAGAFSFYPGKNLGVCGEAGAVTTNDEEVARKIRMLRDHGQAEKYYHDVKGYNGRLDALQARTLTVKLGFLAERNQMRRDRAHAYQELFAVAREAVAQPHEPSWSKAVYHLYVVRVQNRDRLRLHLSDVRIGSGIHYPIPLHIQKAYLNLGYKEGRLSGI